MSRATIERVVACATAILLVITAAGAIYFGMMSPDDVTEKVLASGACILAAGMLAWMVLRR